MISAYELERPEEQRDVFLILGRAGYFGPEYVQAMTAMVSFRKRNRFKGTAGLIIIGGRHERLSPGEIYRAAISLPTPPRHERWLELPIADLTDFEAIAAVCGMGLGTACYCQAYRDGVARGEPGVPGVGAEALGVKVLPSGGKRSRRGQKKSGAETEQMQLGLRIE